MKKTIVLFLLLLSLIASLFSACASGAEAPQIPGNTETAAVTAESAVTPTEPASIPETTVPALFEKTDFLLQTIDGEDYYVLHDFSYPAELGAPVLMLDGTAALCLEGNIDTASKAINNIGDAIHYVMEMESFDSSRAACEPFLRLLEDNFNDLGFITLRGRNFDYSLAYVCYKQNYYPIDIFHIAGRLPSWNAESGAVCLSGADLYALCENIAATFPDDSMIESWVTESLSAPEPFFNPAKHLYPWELSGEVLGQEAVAVLYEAESQYAAEMAITTLEDAITYIKYMDPDTWFQSPMKGQSAWKVLMYMLADDYDDVGVINLMKRQPEHKEGFYDESAYFGNYRLCYVQKDGIYYPVDIDAILRGETSWTLMPGNDCYSGTDLNALCRKMAATCPFKDNHALAQATQNDPMTYWEITSYMYHQGTKMIPVNEFVIPEGLGQPVLSEEEVEALVQETDYERIAEEITTLADALHFYNKLRLVQPRYRNSNGYQGLEYFQSAWQVLKEKTAYGITACSLTRYLLKEDYDEIGYVFAQSANMSTALMYIYDDGLYYLLCPDTYTTEPREDLWIEWPGVIGCAEDFQTIADSCVEYMWFMSPAHCEQVNAVYLIRSEGDMVFGLMQDRTMRFPMGTEVTRYYGPDFSYVEGKLDWQSQTRIDS